MQPYQTLTEVRILHFALHFTKNQYLVYNKILSQTTIWTYKYVYIELEQHR